MAGPQIFTAVVTARGTHVTDTSANALHTIQTGASGGQVAVSAFTVSSSTAVTSSGTTVQTDIVNPGARGVMLFLDVSSAGSSAAASPTLDIKVQGLDTVSGNYFDLPAAAFEQITTSTSTEVMIIHPHTVSDSGTGFIRTPSALTPTYRISYTAASLSSGSTGATYEFTIGGTYIP